MSKILIIIGISLLVGINGCSSDTSHEDLNTSQSESELQYAGTDIGRKWGKICKSKPGSKYGCCQEYARECAVGVGWCHVAWKACVKEIRKTGVAANEPFPASIFTAEELEEMCESPSDCLE